MEIFVVALGMGWAGRKLLDTDLTGVGLVLIGSAIITAIFGILAVLG